MSARRDLALLVIVALSLLLASGLALSRPEMAPRDVGATPGIVTQGDDDGPDDVEPGDGAVGDDDNWDKPRPDVHGPKDAVSRAGSGWVDETPGTEPIDVRGLLSRIWLRLLLAFR